jgi:hypothetical protein
MDWRVEITDRQVEFCKWYRQRLIDCLTKDGLLAELAFSMIGIDLMLRQNEISMLTWDQIYFGNKVIKDVNISKKLSPDQVGFLSYGDLHMTDDVGLSLMFYQFECKRNNGKVFPIVNRGVYYNNIGRSIGDITFNGMKLRQIGITLKAAEVKEGE